jgi:hypothetical protein
MAQIPLSDAIQQLRDQLREAVIEGADKDIVFTPNSIDIELAVTFKAEASRSWAKAFSRSRSSPSSGRRAW